MAALFNTKKYKEWVTLKHLTGVKSTLNLVNGGVVSFSGQGAVSLSSTLV